LATAAVEVELDEALALIRIGAPREPGERVIAQPVAADPERERRNQEHERHDDDGVENVLPKSLHAGCIVGRRGCAPSLPFIIARAFAVANNAKFPAGALLRRRV
jgi:hypothetical protein